MRRFEHRPAVGLHMRHKGAVAVDPDLLQCVFRAKVRYNKHRHLVDHPVPHKGNHKLRHRPAAGTGLEHRKNRKAFRFKARRKSFGKIPDLFSSLKASVRRVDNGKLFCKLLPFAEIYRRPFAFTCRYCLHKQNFRRIIADTGLRFLIKLIKLAFIPDFHGPDPFF